MREIKFRAWNKQEKCIHSWEQLLLHRYNEKWFLDNQDKEYINCIFTDEDLVLQQYTGIKDKNGKEIYEGDAVAPVIINATITEGVIKFIAGCFVVEQISGEYLSVCLGSHNHEFEVIGNIYEG